MTTVLTYDSLLQAICEDPTDPLPKMVIADWYEEQGDLLRAEAWRELREKHPNEEFGEGSDGVDIPSYWWYMQNCGWRYELSCCLQREWVSFMLEGRAGCYQTCRDYSLINQAFLAAVEGYIRWKQREEP